MARQAVSSIPPKAKIHDRMTVLHGWGTAYFPEGIDQLQELYHDPSVNRRWLDKAAAQVDEFPLRETQKEPKTIWAGGETTWEVAYFYDLPLGGQVAVLFPKKKSSPHCAVYARGRGFSDMDMLSRLVWNLHHAIED